METPHALTLEEIKKEYPEQYIQALEAAMQEKEQQIELYLRTNKNHLVTIAALGEQIATLTAERDDLKAQYPAGLVYCPEHRTVVAKIGNKLPCCLIAVLRDAVDKWQAAFYDRGQENKALTAENGKLREALEKIELSESEFDIHMIAQVALKEGGSK